MAVAKKAPAKKTAAAKKTTPSAADAPAPAKRAPAKKAAPAPETPPPAPAQKSDDAVLAEFLGVEEVTPKAIKQWQIRRGHRPTGELTDRQWAEIRAAN